MAINSAIVAMPHIQPNFVFFIALSPFRKGKWTLTAWSKKISGTFLRGGTCQKQFANLADQRLTLSIVEKFQFTCDVGCSTEAQNCPRCQIRVRQAINNSRPATSGD